MSVPVHECFTRVAKVTALVERVAHIELTAEPERKLNNLIRSFRTLPVTVTAA